MIWHSEKLENVISALQTNAERGISPGEAEQRREKYGANVLTSKKKKSFFARFADQLKDFMVIILAIAAVISFVTTIISGENDWIEPIVIIAIVLINAALGVYQETKAENALEALKNMAAPSAKVIRSGAVQIVPASELVPGDLIFLEAGDYIPADARLIETHALRCDESTLTGESVAVEKMIDGPEIPDIASIGDRLNMVYSGCSVTYGSGKAIVTEIGMNTEMGKIATLIEASGERTTPLKNRLAHLGKTLGILALIICAIIFVIGIVEFAFSPSLQNGMTWAEKLIELFVTSVSLAVAAIPEGLPAIVTVVLALGVQRMVKKNAIVKELSAVEALGSASVICSDKTGTLTQNRMTLVKVFDGNEITELGEAELSPAALNLIKMGAICCDGTIELKNGKEVHIGDPTETAIVSAAMKYVPVNKDELNNAYPRITSLPFDSNRKMMTTVNMIDGKIYAIVKGAPDVLIKRCTAGNTEDALKANDEMGKEALRVLAVAFKQLDEVPANPTSDELENGLVFAGLVGMIDPPRPEAIDAIKLCKTAGIRTVMITGDHITTATAIARKLRIIENGDRAITGAELSAMSDGELYENIESISVYARVSPEDKIRIVKAWQKHGDIVAMTGDGVNDAPALKAADIGCAMGITGTDVAKGAASITLTDDNFATIVTAVGEGRGIYDNIKKAVYFLLSCNLGEILTVFFGMLFFKTSPLIAVQLLWINLITDSAPALALGMEPVEYDIMTRPPRSRKENFFAGGMALKTLFNGIIIAAVTLAAFILGKNTGGGIEYGCSMAFAVMALSEAFHAFNARSDHSIFRIGVFSNRPLILAALISVGITLVALLTPLREILGLVKLNSTEWLETVLLSIAPVVISEITKLINFLREKFGNPRG